MSRLLTLIISIYFALCSPLTQAHGQTQLKAKAPPPSPQGILNKLLAPGPLMKGHKDLEHADCLSCHAAGKGVPDRKCLDCHKEIRQSMNKPKSFHKLTEQECIGCHSDHQGRDYDAVQFDTEAFDHNKTGYSLTTEHAKLKCAECHTDTRKGKAIRPNDTRFFGPVATCKSCHIKDDTHDFKGKWAAMDCNECHREDTWKVASWFEPLKNSSPKKQEGFNHNTQTRYQIDGKHSNVACNDCHKLIPNQKAKNSTERQYIWPDLKTKTCESCHKNPHAGKFSPALQAKSCTECHVTSSWTNFPALEKNFDHNQLTRFALTGKHKDITCKSCHVRDGKPIYKFPNDYAGFCVSCHSNIHKDQFRRDYSSEACATCHGTTTFSELKPFNHDKQSNFKLTGDHWRIKDQCIKCHTPTNKILTEEPIKHAGRFIFEHPEKNYCIDCHTNVHKDQFHSNFAEKSCSDCHTTVDFLKNLPFNHNQTNYPIKGKHSELGCIKCHTPTNAMYAPPYKKPKGKYIFPDLKSRNCAACHSDPHKGKLGTRCMDCHSESHNWSSIEDFHKNFLLVGAHNLLSCEQCHGQDNRRRLTGASERCVFCHKKDDNHNGGLPECQQCHSQQTWQATTFHHSMSQFPLIGAHRTAECNACHRNGQYQGTPTDCASCHAKDARAVTFPNHSLPGFEECSECHNQFSFRGKGR